MISFSSEVTQRWRRVVVIKNCSDAHTAARCLPVHQVFRALLPSVSPSLLHLDQARAPWVALAQGHGSHHPYR